MMDCGNLKSKSGKLWKVWWDERSRDIYVEDLAATFFTVKKQVGKAINVKEALAKAYNYLNY